MRLLRAEISVLLTCDSPTHWKPGHRTELGHHRVCADSALIRVARCSWPAMPDGAAEAVGHVVLSDGRKIPIFYRLTDKSGEWKAYDLIIEGVSMVKNYRTQFREIIAKESPEKLLEILRKKVSA